MKNIILDNGDILSNNIMEIIEVLHSCCTIENFGPDEDGDAGMAVEYIDELLSDIHSFIDIRTGASKLVIIPENEDYVIKIGFNGSSYFNSYNYNEEVEEQRETKEDMDIDFDALREEYTEFERFKMIDNDLDYTPEDYCDLENYYYSEADNNHVANAFAYTEKLEVTCANGYGIYIQEKAKDYTTDLISYRENIDNKMVKSARAMAVSLTPTPNSFSASWLGYLLKAFGEEFLENFLVFTTITYPQIGADAHNANIGFSCKDGRPLMIDFSGFYD